MKWYNAVRALVASGFLLAASGGCSLFDCWSVRGGVINPVVLFYSALVAPDTVTVHQPFTVTVTTFGSSTCTRPARVDVSINALVATLVAYDDQRTCGDCTADLHSFPRAVEVRFAVTGQAIVRLTGLDSTVERTVVVRP
jgi:hypothetical protein